MHRMHTLNDAGKAAARVSKKKRKGVEGGDDAQPADGPKGGAAQMPKSSEPSRRKSAAAAEGSNPSSRGPVKEGGRGHGRPKSAPYPTFPQPVSPGREHRPEVSAKGAPRSSRATAGGEPEEVPAEPGSHSQLDPLPRQVEGGPPPPCALSGQVPKKARGRGKSAPLLDQPRTEALADAPPLAAKASKRKSAAPCVPDVRVQATEQQEQGQPSGASHKRRKVELAGGGGSGGSSGGASGGGGKGEGAGVQVEGLGAAHSNGGASSGGGFKRLEELAKEQQQQQQQQQLQARSRASSGLCKGRGPPGQGGLGGRGKAGRPGLLIREASSEAHGCGVG